MTNNSCTIDLANYTSRTRDPYVIYGVSSAEAALESAILLLISSVAFTANASLWLVVCTTRDLRTESNVLILCLSLADLLVAMVGAPITISSIISSQWLFSSAVCTFVGYLNMLTFVASVQSLGAISVNRYFKICRPAKYLDVYTFRNVGFMFLGVWLYSGLLSIPPLVGWASYDFLPLASICFCNWARSPSYAVFMILMCFCVPCFAMILCYVAIIKAFLRSRRTVQAFANSIKKGAGTTPSTHALSGVSSKASEASGTPSDATTAGNFPSTAAAAAASISQQQYSCKNTQTQTRIDKLQNKQPILRVVAAAAATAAATPASSSSRDRTTTTTITTTNRNATMTAATTKTTITPADRNAPEITVKSNSSSECVRAILRPESTWTDLGGKNKPMAGNSYAPSPLTDHQEMSGPNRGQNKSINNNNNNNNTNNNKTPVNKIVNVQENTLERNDNNVHSRTHNPVLIEDISSDSFIHKIKVRIKRPVSDCKSYNPWLTEAQAGVKVKNTKTCSLRHTCITSGFAETKTESADVFSERNAASHGLPFGNKATNRKNDTQNKKSSSHASGRLPEVDGNGSSEKSSFILSNSDDLLGATDCDFSGNRPSLHTKSDHLSLSSSVRHLSQLDPENHGAKRVFVRYCKSTGNITEEHCALLPEGSHTGQSKIPRTISLNYELYSRTNELEFRSEKYSNEWPSYEKSTHSKYHSNEVNHHMDSFNNDDRILMNSIHDSEIPTDGMDTSDDECEQRDYKNQSSNYFQKGDILKMTKLPRKSNLLQLPSAYSLDRDSDLTPSSASTSLASSDLSSSSNQRIHLNMFSTDGSARSRDKYESPASPISSLRLSKSEEQLHSSPCKDLTFRFSVTNRSSHHHTAEYAAVPPSLLAETPLSRKSVKLSASSPSVLTLPPTTGQKKSKHRAKKGIHSHRRAREEFQLSASLLVVILIFIICWFPYCISMFISFTSPESASHALDIASLLLGYMNSCVNPLVYGLMNRRFKMGYRNLYARCLRCLPFVNKSKAKVAPMKGMNHSNSSMA